MNNAYRKLMEQICISEQVKREFYHNAQQSEGKKTRCFSLKAATVAVCILLLIPITVLAVENVFGIVIIDHVERADVHNEPGVGVDVKFGNVQNRPITDFSEHLQSLDGGVDIIYDSWEAAEEDLGIDLLSNSICHDEQTQKIDLYVDGNLVREHCAGRYLGMGGQLYYANVSAIYERKQVKFQVAVEVTAEHPIMTDEQLQQYHSSSDTYLNQYDPKVTTEPYTTKNGIPATIRAVRLEDEFGGFTEYRAYFAVDNITYTIQCIGKEGVWDDAAIYSVICEVLDGFALT